MRYRHIIWDWNGTLLDDTWLCFEIFNIILREHGLPETTFERHRDEFEFPAERYYRRMGLDTSPEGFARNAQAFMGRYEARRLECKLHAHATEILSALAQAGYAMSVLSAYKEDTLRELIAHYGLAPWLPVLTGQTNIRGEGKLDRVQLHLGKINADGPLLMVGDSPHDFEVAKALGADCVLVSHGHFPAERLKILGAPVVGSLEALAAFLEMKI